MKIIILFLTIGLLIISGFGAAAITINVDSSSIPQINSMDDYTHTVFVEIASGQFCSPCDNWNTNISDVYNSGDFNFEYVHMVIWGFGGFSDILNTEADQWKDPYGITSAPDSIFDGDFERLTGNFPNNLPTKLDASGARVVKDIEANISLGWLGEGKIKVNIEITNNEADTYNGFIRVPITEINSRYKTLNGGIYHNAFLDYALQEDISIPAGQNYTDSVVWDGNDHEDNNGDDFGDIDPDNIKVILGVFNDENGFVDETVAATHPVNSAPNKPTIYGPTSGSINSPHTYQLYATDPEDSDIYYYVNWGDGTNSGWLGPYSSGEECEATHTWTQRSQYKITLKAKDIYNYESEETTLNVNMPRYRTVENFVMKLINQFPILKLFLNL